MKQNLPVITVVIILMLVSFTVGATVVKSYLGKLANCQNQTAVSSTSVTPTVASVSATVEPTALPTKVLQFTPKKTVTTPVVK